ncbi:hypothetical protein B1R32_1019 [Abditibacterium utsteinense]|uniref:PglZ domain-containing protein n=1 Tax=Abditibacterium utsteinense TaxID=1960156 RepID=A0A2S8SWU4_9BACT|nr:hypothetical protein [Abditibacterium utsteinense]PQV65272.1 hypothetical protein B1R32_1019 [Abditibacterium utsteinense]
MASSLRLDWKGDAEIPEGARLVTNEVEWLRVAPTLQAPDAQDVWVRGATVCKWASQWWQAAGGKCEEVRGAIDTLLAISPDLSREEAKGILGVLSTHHRAEAKGGFQLSEILAELFPNFGEEGLGWKRAHTLTNRLEIAAQWLLWLEEQHDIEPSHAKLMAHQTEIWRESGEDCRDLFPCTSKEATSAIRAWLGLEENKTRGAFAARPPFPEVLPARWLDEARGFYAKAFTLMAQDETGAMLHFWHRFERSNAPFALREVAAETLCEVLIAHPECISSELVALLEPLVSAPMLSKVRALKPPLAPPALPDVKSSGAGSILDWVTQKYLPFRAWQCENENTGAGTLALQSAQEFGEWFLSFYENAMIGAARQFLQIHRAGELRSSETSEITFWVIADGLGWLDARTLARLVTEKSQRFSLGEMAPYFATIPTITSFAKPSLRWSAPPDQVPEVSGNGRRRESEVSGHKEAATTLKTAKPGDLVIWTPLDPDKTYHESADANILRGRVAGVLAGLAQNIVEAALGAPADVPLKIVVTTDHGRLLGSSIRSHPSPVGFTGHGRAAYGNSKPDLEGSPGVRWLDPDLYRCKSHVVIATDEGAFLTNASEGAAARTGIEKFPHGGIFPEEVVVPWLVFERDAAPIRVEAVLSGKGRAGRLGKAALRLINFSNRALLMENIELRYGGKTGTGVIFTPVTVAAFGHAEIEVQLDAWPETAQARDLTMLVLLRAPDGRLVQSVAEIHLQVEALQTRENILGDLI